MTGHRSGRSLVSLRDSTVHLHCHCRLRRLSSSVLTINWRTWMTEQYLALDSWAGLLPVYQVLRSDTDNPDQRISEDINQFVSWPDHSSSASSSN